MEFNSLICRTSYFHLSNLDINLILLNIKVHYGKIMKNGSPYSGKAAFSLLSIYLTLPCLCRTYIPDIV